MKGRIEKVNLSAVKAEDFFPISAYTSFMNRVGREEIWGEKRKKQGTMEREEKAGELQESRKQGGRRDRRDGEFQQRQRETRRTSTFHLFSSEGCIICHLLRAKEK